MSESNQPIPPWEGPDLLVEAKAAARKAGESAGVRAKPISPAVRAKPRELTWADFEVRDEPITAKAAGANSLPSALLESIGRRTPWPVQPLRLREKRRGRGSQPGEPEHLAVALVFEDPEAEGFALRFLPVTRCRKSGAPMRPALRSLSGLVYRAWPSAVSARASHGGISRRQWGSLRSRRESARRPLRGARAVAMPADASRLGQIRMNIKERCASNDCRVGAMYGSGPRFGGGFFFSGGQCNGG